MDKPKKHFLFNLEWEEILSELPKEVKYEVYDAIIEYAKSGKLLDLKPIAKGCFLFIKKELDYYFDSYARKSKVRKEAGSKGGSTSQNKQKQAKQANASFANQNKQMQANASINKNKIITDLNKSFPNVKDSSVSDAPDAPPQENLKGEINFSQLRDFFNETMAKANAVIPRIQKFTDKRKTVVKARCREFGKEAIMQVIVKASESSFLNGGGSHGFKADFDWLFRPNNFPKVLEGNYNDQNLENRTNNRPQPGGFRSKLPPEPGCGLIED